MAQSQGVDIGVIVALIDSISKENAALVSALGISNMSANTNGDGILFTMSNATQYDIPLSGLPYLSTAMLSDSVTTDDNNVPASSRAIYLIGQMFDSIETNYVKNDRLTSNINGDSTSLVATQKAINELKNLITLATTGMVYMGGISATDFNSMSFGTRGEIYKALDGITLDTVTIPKNALIIIKTDFSGRTIAPSDFDYFVGNQDLHNVLNGLEGGNSSTSHFYHSDQPINKTDSVEFAGVTSSIATIATLNSTSGSFGSVKLGSDSPSIKVKKYTGNMPAVGQTLNVPHGLTQSKIISFTCIITDNSGGTLRAPNSTVGQDIEYYARIKSDGTIWLSVGGNGTLIAGSPYKFLIWYEA